MNILTFDIEEWFLSGNNKRNPPESWHRFESRVESNTLKILELLELKGIKATFFILGWIAENYPALVRQIAGEGHEIGYHTYYHQHLSEFIPDGFLKDLEKGIPLLEDLSGKKVTAFRAPYFSLTGLHDWAYEVLIDKGIQASSSVKSGITMNMQIVEPRPFRWTSAAGSLIEFPLTRISWHFVKTLYPGSGYLRVLPFRMMKKLLQNHEYLMFYFHPRDIDNRIPVSRRLSPMRNIRNLAGAGTGLTKLKTLLDSFDFFSVESALQAMQESEYGYITWVADPISGFTRIDNQ